MRSYTYADGFRKSRMADNLIEEILSLFSYCQHAGYKPHSCVVLLERIMKLHNNRIIHRDVELTRHIVNMLVKLGFMLLAYDTIHHLNGKSKHPAMKIQVEYHLYNFIYYTKSFLDSVAVTLNHTYNLGLEKGEIDLNKEKFIKALEARCDETLMIVMEVRREGRWINNVVQWRDTLIHRYVTSIVHYGDPDITLDFIIKMPREPVKLFDSQEMKKLTMKYGTPMQDIHPFCEEWVKKSKTLLETVGNNLLIKF